MNKERRERRQDRKIKRKDSGSAAFTLYVVELEYGGGLSVRMKPCEMVWEYVGQDEVIYKQYQFPTMHWVAPDGTIAPVGWRARENGAESDIIITPNLWGSST